MGSIAYDLIEVKTYFVLCGWKVAVNLAEIQSLTYNRIKKCDIRDIHAD